MSNTAAQIQIFFDESDQELSNTYSIPFGESVIGSNRKKCNICVGFKNVLDEKQAKFQMEESDYSIENLSSTIQIYKVNGQGNKIPLKIGKQYDLGLEDVGQKCYYFGKYKVIIRKQPTGQTQQSQNSQGILQMDNIISLSQDHQLQFNNSKNQKKTKINITYDNNDTEFDDIESVENSQTRFDSKLIKNTIQTQNISKNQGVAQKKFVKKVQPGVQKQQLQLEILNGGRPNKRNKQTVNYEESQSQQVQDSFYNESQECQFSPIEPKQKGTKKNQSKNSLQEQKNDKDYNIEQEEDPEIQKLLKTKEIQDKTWEKTLKKFQKEDEKFIKQQEKKLKNKPIDINNLLQKYSPAEKTNELNSTSLIKQSKKTTQSKINDTKKDNNTIGKSLVDRLKQNHPSQFEQSQNEEQEQEIQIQNNNSKPNKRSNRSIKITKSDSLKEDQQQQDDSTKLKSSSISRRSSKKNDTEIEIEPEKKQEKEKNVRKTRSNESLKGEDLFLDLAKKTKQKVAQKRELQKQQKLQEQENKKIKQSNIKQQTNTKQQKQKVEPKKQNKKQKKIEYESEDEDEENNEQNDTNDSEQSEIDEEENSQDDDEEENSQSESDFEIEEPQPQKKVKKENIKQPKNNKKQNKILYEDEQDVIDEYMKKVSPANKTGKSKDIQTKNTKQNIKQLKNKKQQEEDIKKSDKKNDKIKGVTKKKETKVEQKKQQKTQINQLPNEIKKLKTSFYAKEPNCLPKRNDFRILFSNCSVQDEEKNELKRLGMKLINSIDDNFNVLVMDGFRRRTKVLVAINKGSYIVSYDWVKQCINENTILPPDQFILQPSQKDLKKYDFNLEQSIINSQIAELGLFEELNFFIPQDSGIEVPKDEIQQIIESGNGNLKKQIDDSCLIIINEQNKDSFNKYVKENILQDQPIYSQELVLTSVLKQERPINLDQYELVYVQKQQKRKR